MLVKRYLWNFRVNLGKGVVKCNPYPIMYYIHGNETEDVHT